MDERILHAPIGFVKLDREGIILRVNDHVLNLTGFLHQEVNGTSFQVMLTVASRIYFQSYFIPTINLKQNISEMYVNLRAVKSDIPIVLNATKLEDGTMDLYFIAVPSRDKYVRALMDEREFLKSRRIGEEMS